MTPKQQHRHFIGIVSDTHGHKPPMLKTLFHNVDLIIHAGDIGDSSVLDFLGAIAPVHAVRGNMDHIPEWSRLPETAIVTIGSHRFFVLHDLEELDFDPQTAGFMAVIHGHTHQASHQRQGGVDYINPGSAAGIRSPHATAALVTITDNALTVSCINLDMTKTHNP